MLRLCYVVVVSLPFIIYYIGKVRFIERHGGFFSETRRYKIAQRCIRIMMRNGRIRTMSYGQELLPEEGGYVMYSNHQGKYDTLGIMHSHPTPCTIVMDYTRSMLPIVNPFIDLVKGKRLDKSDMKSQMKTILEIVEEVKAGRRYIIFPEGGYDHNKNTVQRFMPGSFKCAQSLKRHLPMYGAKSIKSCCKPSLLISHIISTSSEAKPGVSAMNVPSPRS